MRRFRIVLWAVVCMAAAGCAMVSRPIEKATTDAIVVDDGTNRVVWVRADGATGTVTRTGAGVQVNFYIQSAAVMTRTYVVEQIGTNTLNFAMGGVSHATTVSPTLDASAVKSGDVSIGSGNANASASKLLR